MLRGVLRILEGGWFGFWCPGCEEIHAISNAWTFDGNYDAPTFSPSVLVTCGHYCPSFKAGESCWCTYNIEHANDPSPFACSRCHSFVRNGHIEFLSDSTHKLAGQTVALLAPPEH